LYERHTRLVNRGQYDYPFQVYYNTYLSNALDSAKSVVACEHNDYETVQKFEKFVEDFHNVLDRGGLTRE
jgi:hypothetical protein